MIYSLNGMLIKSISITSCYTFDNGWGAIIFEQNEDEDCIVRIPSNTLKHDDARRDWIIARLQEQRLNVTGAPKNTEFATFGLVSGDDLVRELARIAALPPIDDAAMAARVADDLLSKLRKR